MPSVGDLFIRVGADLSSLNGLGKKLERSLRPVRSALKSIGTGLSVGLTAPLALLGKRAFDSAVKLDSLTRGLTAIAGSSAEAQKQLSRLKDVAKLPGLSFEDAVQGSINLQAAGLSANLSERSLKAVGNALATVGKGAADLAGVNLALTQMASKSKVSAEEINQLNERIPQIRQILNDAFGTAEGGEISKLGFTTREVIEKIVTELEKLPPVSGGISNELENVGQSINEAFAAIGAAILPVVSDILSKVTPVIENISAAFQSLSPEMQKAAVIFAAVAAALGPLAFAFSALLSPIGLVVGAIAAIAAGAFLIVKNWQSITRFFARLWNNVKTIFTASLGQLRELVVGFFIKVADVFTEGISNLVGIFGTLAEKLGFDEFASKIADAQATLKGFVSEEVLTENRENARKFKEEFDTAFDDILANASNTSVSMVSAFAGAVATVKKLVSSIGTGGSAPPPKPEEEDKVANQERVDSLRTRIAAGQEGIGKVEGSGLDLREFTQDLPAANTAFAEFADTIRATFGEFLNIGPAVSNAFFSFDAAISEGLFQLVTLRKGFDGVENALKSFGRAARDIMRQFIADLIKAIAKAAALKAITAAATAIGGPAGGFLGRIASGIFGGGRAAGGPVTSGVSYIVGERGPELFTPRQSGRIIPNGAGGMTSIPVALQATYVDVGSDVLRFKVQQADKTSVRRRGY